MINKILFIYNFNLIEMIVKFIFFMNKMFIFSRKVKLIFFFNCLSVDMYLCEFILRLG